MSKVFNIVVKESKVNPTVKSEILISDNYNESLDFYTSNITEETISLLKDGKEILFENAKVLDKNSDTIAEGKLTLKVIHNETITYEGMSEFLYLSLIGIFELPPEVIPDTPLVKKHIYPVWATIEGANDYMTMSIGIAGTY